MSTKTRKRALTVSDQSSDLHAEEQGPPQQRNRSFSRTTDESIDRLTAVMANFIETTTERERPSTSTMKGDIVPTFNPEDKGQTVVSWCQKVDELREIFNWSEEATIYFAMTKLRGLAETWYKSLPSLKFTWGEWKLKLIEGFPSKRNYCADLQEMLHRRKRPDETYTRYYYEKVALLNNCKIFGADAVSCIIGGINDIVVKTGASAGDYQTTESLYTYLSTLSNISGTMSVSSKFTPKNQFNRHYKKKNFSKSERIITCYTCKRPGHTANVCDQKEYANKPANKTLEKRCNFCRRSGHLEIDCFLKKRSLNSKQTI